MNCKLTVKCWDHQLRPCKREANHAGGCNPFSATHPLTTQVVRMEVKKFQYPINLEKDELLLYK